MEHAVHQLAQGREGRVRARLARHQRDLRGDGSVLRHDPLPRQQDGAADLEQLGLHQRSGVRQAGRRGAHRPRSGRARQGARRPARALGRRGGVPVGRA